MQSTELLNPVVREAFSWLMQIVINIVATWQFYAPFVMIETRKQMQVNSSLYLYTN